MKIFIGSIEVAGLIHDLGKEFKRQGHEVTTIADDVNSRFYNYSYDINPYNTLTGFLKTHSNWPKITKITYQLLGLCFSNWQERFRVSLIKKMLRDADLFIFIWSSAFWDEENLLKYLKSKNIPIVTMFLGSEIRDYEEFSRKYNITRWKFPLKYFKTSALDKINKLRLHEKYSTQIYSVPDQSLHALRSYRHLQLPFQVDKFHFNIPKRDKPIVIHCPSEPHIKGTDVIKDTLNKLKLEGVRFEFEYLSNIPHNELLFKLANADVLVDEIILHGPGLLGFEGMFSGCAVATKFLYDSPPSFRPPILAIDEENIYEKLKLLLTNKKLRIELAIKGRDYALKNNDIKKIVKDFLTQLDSKETDYPNN
tara:strand:+ start:192 stop:1289 length:1098 start_codon:yes stop_codon:yes gene_type:complete